MSVCLSVRLSVSLSLCLSVSLSVCLCGCRRAAFERAAQETTVYEGRRCRRRHDVQRPPAKKGPTQGPTEEGGRASADEGQVRRARGWCQCKRWNRSLVCRSVCLITFSVFDTSRADLAPCLRATCYCRCPSSPATPARGSRKGHRATKRAELEAVHLDVGLL